jgi:hypothetical protein
MTSLDVATKASANIVLLPLLAVRYLEVSGVLPRAPENLQHDPKLLGQSSIRLRVESGDSYSDEDIVWHCRNEVCKGTNQSTDEVCTPEIKTTIEPRLTSVQG